MSRLGYSLNRRGAIVAEPTLPMSFDFLQRVNTAVKHQTSCLDGMPTADEEEALPDSSSDLTEDKVPPSGSSETTRTAWLAWQCQMISGTLQGEIHEVESAKVVSTVAEIWPPGATASPRLASFAARACHERTAFRQSTGESDENADPCTYVAQPILMDDVVKAVVVFKLAHKTDVQLRAVMQLLRWGVLWFRTLLQQAAPVQAQQPAEFIELLQILLQPVDLATAVPELCDALSARYQCDRVSIGAARALGTRLVGVSRNVQIVSHSSLQQDLEAAMTEACDLEKPVKYPDADESAMCHTVLARRQAMGFIYTLPLQFGEHTYGAITLERKVNRAVTPGERSELDMLAPTLGHQLESMVRAHNSVGGRLSRVGKRLSGGKAIVAGMTLIIAALCLVPGTYRVDSTATVMGSIQQAVVAPIDGYIAAAMVRAGDTVQNKQVLAQLEEFDLNLVRQKWQSEYERNTKTYVEALATKQRAQSGIAVARMAETEAELQLVDERLKRAVLRAPFSGLVVSGDLSQALGTPVSRGEVLFEVAPLDDYRVISEVSERDIADVALGQRGQLRLIGMPDLRFDMTVRRIAPLATAEDGRTFFRVEAQMDQPDSRIRPGMQGIAKLDVGQRPILWIWTHNVWSRLRLWLWSMGM